MATETELKLRIPPEEIAVLRAHPLLAGKRPRSLEVHNLYFDTPDLELSRHGMALRLRRIGKRWLQTLKSGASGDGGLHSRNEWEFPATGAVVDLARLAGTPLAALEDAATLHARLRPAFTTDFRRLLWRLEPAPGIHVELALDTGTVRSGTREATISEVEIEVKSGSASAAFAIAGQLQETVRLFPSPVNKAETGYRLFRRQAVRPAKAGATGLEKPLTPQEAARRIVASCLAHLQANETGAVASTDPEFVHQMRVANRRLRSALRAFPDAIGPDFLARVAPDLKWLGTTLGHARDWDVLVTGTLPPLAAAFGDAAACAGVAKEAARHRRVARAAMREALTSIRFARLMLALSRWCALGEAAPLAPGAPDTLVDFASRVVRRRHGRLAASGAQLAGLAPEERHQLRLDAKRLRYTVEFFAPLFNDKRVGDYVERLEAIQDTLGAANDAVNAQGMFASLAAPEVFLSFSRGWFLGRAGDGIARSAELFAALAQARRFWKRKPVPPEARPEDSNPAM
jgi:inorganic triphosphatase YgiF